MAGGEEISVQDTDLGKGHGLPGCGEGVADKCRERAQPVKLLAGEEFED